MSVTPGDGGSASGSDAEDGVEGGGREDGGKEEEAVPVVTLKLLSGWARALGKGGAAFGTLRDLVRAFECACHLDDVEDARAKKAKAKRGDAPPRFKFRIVSGLVFERLMRLCVTKMHLFFHLYLELKEPQVPAPPGPGRRRAHGRLIDSRPGWVKRERHDDR